MSVSSNVSRSRCGRRCSVATLFFVLLLINSYVYAYDPLYVKLPDVPVYPKSQWSWVGERMSVDGVPTSIKIFETPAPLDEVVQFYQGHWRTEGHGQFTDSDYGTTRVIGYELDGFYRTVQISNAGNVRQGKIVVTPSPNQPPRKAPKSRIPVPRGASVISRIESLDAGRRSETLTLIYEKNLEMTTSYYRKQLDMKGWKRVHSAPGPNSLVEQYESSEGQLQITIKSLPGANGKATQILVHWFK